LTGEGARLQGRKNAVDLKDCREQGKRSHFDAEIHASDVCTLQGALGKPFGYFLWGTILTKT
jgi:hypothetical protein